MSPHVAITGLLCLLLLAALVRYRATRPARPGGESRTGPGRARLGKVSLRLGRGSRTTEPDPPRQRRHRPRLGLTVSGVPTEEALLNTPDAASTEPSEEPAAVERSNEANDAAILELAAGAVISDDNRSGQTAHPAEEPSPAHHAVPDDATEDIPVALRGVVQDVAVIEAPGWPQPGELGLSSATDGFTTDPNVAVAAEQDEGIDDLIAEPAIAVPATGDDGRSEVISDDMWDDPVAGFDPVSGWDQSDDEPSSPIPDAIPADWATHELEAVLDDPWAPPETIPPDVGGADDEEWNVTEWEFATVATPSAATPMTRDDGESTRDGELNPTVFPGDAPVFTWSPEEDALAPEPDPEPEPYVADLGPTSFADPPAGEPAQSLDVDGISDARAAVPALEAATWAEPAGETAETGTEAPDESVGPSDTLKRLARDKRTKQLERRLAAAEAELRRIAKRTTGKKGDLRKAGKDKIARQVRKALRDPELAHHFDLKVGKGRFAFGRRAGEPPVVTLGATLEQAGRDGATGSELLTALEGPLRANLLAMLLSDYAHAEADRRVAALRSRNGGGGDPGEFDALVARLAELSQDALLGIEPSRRPV